MVKSLTRWVVYLILSALFSSVAGLLGTAANQARQSIAGLEIPVGLILSVLSLTLFWLALRLLVQNRWLVFIGGVAEFTTVWVFIFGRGRNLLPNEPTAWIWLTLPPVICALILAWPASLKKSPKTKEPK